MSARLMTLTEKYVRMSIPSLKSGSMKYRIFATGDISFKLGRLSVNVYPNPADQMVTISVENDDGYQRSNHL